MRAPLQRGRRHRRDSGAVLLLFALSITAIMVIVALVIDLSNVRNTRQDSKSTTDASTAAGLQSLVDDIGVPRPWRAVCTSLAYLKVNQPDRTFSIDYRDGAGTPLDTSVTGDPCTDLLDEPCVATDKASWAWIRATDGDFVADIRSGYSTPDPNFAEDQSAYAGDNGEPCEQVAVIVSKTDPAFFGGVAGESSYDSAIRSVGRVDIDIKGKGVPAFMMLERTSCQVLSQAVGSSEGGIIVEAPNASEPGIIHVDSAGNPAECTGNSEKNFTVYSGTLGSSPKRPGIVVKGIGANPGILSLYALESGNLDHAWSTTDGVSAAKRAGDVISRQPVDDKYNPSGNPTIKALHEATQPLANSSDAPDATYTTVNTCTGHNEVVAATKVFVDCNTGYEAANATFTNATEIIFNGPVHVPNGGQLYMPAAQRVVVGGTSDGGLSVALSGRLGVNSVTPFTDGDLEVQAACTGREGPAHTKTTQLVIFGGRSSGSKSGALNVTGRAALCQTFVYLAGPKTLDTHDRQVRVDTNYHASCVEATPCPSNDTDTTHAHLDVAGYLKWSAPNQLTVPPTPGAVGVEDLALWTETETLSKVDGTLDVQGVYFFPNGRVETRSPADFSPTDAQFIARSLKLLQGTLQMKPTPANSVEVEISVGFTLVR